MPLLLPSSMLLLPPYHARLARGRDYANHVRLRRLDRNLHLVTDLVLKLATTPVVVLALVPDELTTQVLLLQGD